MELIWWQIIAIAFTITFCITWLIGVARKNKARLIFKKKEGEGTTIGIDASDLKDIPTPVALLGEDEKIKDFIILIHKTINYSDKKNDIINSIIRDQMNNADLKLKQIETILNKSFSSAVFEEFGSSIDLTREASYVIFHSCLRIGMQETLMRMKQSFRENHLTTKSEYEFIDYIEEQSDRLYYNAEMLFTTQYLYTLKPGPDSIKKKIALYRIQIKNVLKDCFISARDIAAAKERELNELEGDFDKDCRSFSGSDIVGAC